MLATTFAATEQVHRLDGYTGQARVVHEPAHVFRALAVGVGNRDSPHPVSPVSAADENLLAVKDVFVAVADRAHFYSGEVGAGARLREQLPHAHFTPMNRRPKGLLLFLSAPDENSWRTERAAGVIEGRERKVEAGGFLFEDDLMVHVEAAAAVLLRSHRE